MKMIGCLSLALSALSLLCCSSDNATSESKQGTASIDSAVVIENGIEYAFKNTMYSPNSYLLPVKIIKSKNVPSDLRFKIHGQFCELVDSSLSDSERAKNSNNPLFYVDVQKLESVSQDSVELILLLPSIKQELWMRMKKDERNSKNVRLTADINY